jgi:hypothetical protein
MVKLGLFLFFVIGLVPASSSYAEVISNPGKGYSFDFPSGWSNDKKEKDFTVRAGADLAISELSAPHPPKGADLSFVSSMNQMAALATGSCGQLTEKGIALTGDKWQGEAFLCSNPKTAKVAARQGLTLTVKHGAEFYVFVLTVPAETWSKQKDSYMSLLKSLRFGRP